MIEVPIGVENKGPDTGQNLLDPLQHSHESRGYVLVVTVIPISRLDWIRVGLIRAKLRWIGATNTETQLPWRSDGNRSHVALIVLIRSLWGFNGGIWLKSPNI